jgi:protein arginine kinase activator
VHLHPYFLSEIKRNLMMLVEKRPCMNCHQNLATIKFTRMINGALEEEYLCRQCAAAKSPYQKKSLPQLDEILSGILGASATGEAATTIKSSELTCSTCGLPFASYRESLILGCSDCYESFEKLLVNDLRRFHGAAEHTGRIPHSQAQEVENFRNAEDLRKRLTDAVKAEDFVLAAKLRDQLKTTEASVVSETDSGEAAN